MNINTSVHLNIPYTKYSIDFIFFSNLRLQFVSGFHHFQMSNWSGNYDEIFVYISLKLGGRENSNSFFEKRGLRLPLYNSISGAYYCHPLSIVSCFVETRRCFRRCLQVSSSSSLLFSIVWGFSVSITSFSVKHRSQDWLPLENAWPCALIDQTTLGVTHPYL